MNKFVYGNREYKVGILYQNYSFFFIKFNDISTLFENIIYYIN